MLRPEQNLTSETINQMTEEKGTFSDEPIIPVETNEKKPCLHAASMHMGGILSASLITKIETQTPVFLCPLKPARQTQSINQSTQNETLHHELVTDDSDSPLHAFDTHLRAVVPFALTASSI